MTKPPSATGARSCGACIAACRNNAILTDAAPREVPDFSDYQGIWVFAEQRDGELNRVSLELLGKARELGQTLNQEVAALLLGHQVEALAATLIEHGADKVYLVDHQGLARLSDPGLHGGHRRTGEHLQSPMFFFWARRSMVVTWRRGFHAGSAPALQPIAPLSASTLTRAFFYKPGRPLVAMSWPPSPTASHAPKWPLYDRALWRSARPLTTKARSSTTRPLWMKPRSEPGCLKS